MDTTQNITDRAEKIARDYTEDTRMLFALFERSVMQLTRLIARRGCTPGLFVALRAAYQAAVESVTQEVER